MSYSENIQDFWCRRTDCNTRQNRYLRDDIGLPGALPQKDQAHASQPKSRSDYAVLQGPTTQRHKVKPGSKSCRRTGHLLHINRLMERNVLYESSEPRAGRHTPDDDTWPKDPGHSSNQDDNKIECP
jgi:hypothetical protein